MVEDCRLEDDVVRRELVLFLQDVWLRVEYVSCEETCLGWGPTPARSLLRCYASRRWRGYVARGLLLERAGVTRRAAKTRHVWFAEDVPA